LKITGDAARRTEARGIGSVKKKGERRKAEGFSVAGSSRVERDPGIARWSSTLPWAILLHAFSVKTHPLTQWY